MATSSIGRPVILDEERAKRLMDIMSRPHKPAQSESGERVHLTHVSELNLDPNKSSCLSRLLYAVYVVY